MAKCVRHKYVQATCCPICLYDEWKREVAQNKRLREAIADALADCEICRGVPGPSNCARCKTFRKLLCKKGDA